MFGFILSNLIESAESVCGVITLVPLPAWSFVLICLYVPESFGAAGSVGCHIGHEQWLQLCVIFEAVYPIDYPGDSLSNCREKDFGFNKQ